jgi:hypothetical protein
MSPRSIKTIIEAEDKATSVIDRVAQQYGKSMDEIGQRGDSIKELADRFTKLNDLFGEGSEKARGFAGGIKDIAQSVTDATSRFAGWVSQARELWSILSQIRGVGGLGIALTGAGAADWLGSASSSAAGGLAAGGLRGAGRTLTGSQWGDSATASGAGGLTGGAATWGGKAIYARGVGGIRGSVTGLGAAALALGYGARGLLKMYEQDQDYAAAVSGLGMYEGSAGRMVIGEVERQRREQIDERRSSAQFYGGWSDRGFVPYARSDQAMLDRRLENLDGVIAEGRRLNEERERGVEDRELTERFEALKGGAAFEDLATASSKRRWSSRDAIARGNASALRSTNDSSWLPYFGAQSQTGNIAKVMDAWDAIRTGKITDTPADELLLSPKRFGPVIDPQRASTTYESHYLTGFGEGGGGSKVQQDQLEVLRRIERNKTTIVQVKV